MRGRGYAFLIDSEEQRITPAYAGKSLFRHQLRGRPEDHPRVCGEESFCSHPLIAPAGSPPRMRGRGVIEIQVKLYSGITPAYAGKSEIPSEMYTPTEDHPRVCGEECLESKPPGKPGGSPPRMRGRARAERGFSHQAGITPAYAGKSTHPLSGGVSQ